MEIHDFSFWPELLTILVIFGILQGTCAMLIYLERKISAWVQDRVGPNRVGPAGLLQSVADGLKFLLKEDIIPSHVNKFLFLLAPCIALTTAMLAFAVVPFGPVEPPPPVAPAPLPEDASAEVRRQYEHARRAFEAQDRVYREAVGDPDTYRKTYQFVIAPGVDIGILFVFAVGS